MVGKTVFSTIQEIIEPSHAALVIWDLQNPVVDYIFNKDEFMKKLTFN
jgi:hypothetical protein